MRRVILFTMLMLGVVLGFSLTGSVAQASHNSSYIVKQTRPFVQINNADGGAQALRVVSTLVRIKGNPDTGTVWTVTRPIMDTRLRYYEAGQTRLFRTRRFSVKFPLNEWNYAYLETFVFYADGSLAGFQQNQLVGIGEVDFVSLDIPQQYVPPPPPPPPPVDPPPPVGAQIRIDNPISSDLHVVGFRYSREATTASPGGGQDAFGFINPEGRGAQPWVMLTTAEVVTDANGNRISEPLMVGKQYNLELFYGYTDEFTGEPVVVRGESWFNIQLPAVLVIGSGQPDG